MENGGYILLLFIVIVGLLFYIEWNRDKNPPKGTR